MCCLRVKVENFPKSRIKRKKNEKRQENQKTSPGLSMSQ